VATELTVENLLWTIKFLGYLNRTEQLLSPCRFGGGVLYCFDFEWPLGGFNNYTVDGTRIHQAFLPHDYTFDNLRENVEELRNGFPSESLQEYLQEIEDWLEENQDK
jgi:hypothetical protein